MARTEKKQLKPQTPAKRPANRKFFRTSISRMTQKGQVTISAGMRNALGLHPGDQVIMSLQPDNAIRIERIMSFKELIDSLPLAIVPPIDWKAAREEMAEEIAEKVFRQIAEANERHNQHEIR